MSKSRMKLQINTSGAWRDVISYDRRDDSAIRHFSAVLSQFAEPKPGKLRLLSETSEVSAYWTPDHGWYAPGNQP